MGDIWSFLLQTLTASGAAALLLLVKAMLRDKLSPRWQFAVWGMLALSLLIPAGLGGRYALVNWPLFVEALRSALTGEYGALARVTAPVPLFRFDGLPRTGAERLYAVYLAGVVLLLARYAVSYLRLRMALRRGAPALEAQRARIAAAAERYSLPLCPAVEVPGLESAFICGVFRPVLALPAGEDANEKVILHELLHLKHHDAAWGLLICLFRCLHWCNPLLWYCADRAGNDLESLCDQRVLERLEGEARRDYGRILLSMASERYARVPGTSSMANGGKNIRRRIEAIARFKRYPAGMALASVCIALVLTAPCLIGTQAQAVYSGKYFVLPGGLDASAAMASARTTYCTTYAGAFDAYAKAMLTGEIPYRAMCAPLAEQNELAAAYRQGNNRTSWLWDQSGGGETGPGRQSGYQIYNLTQAGEAAWEGLLALTLSGPPEGETWDGTVYSRWMAVQPLRAEREGNRWVIRSLGDLQPMQGDMRAYSNNDGLPAWTYEAQFGDILLRNRFQTTCCIASYVQNDSWFFSSQSFDAVPQPGGQFTDCFYNTMLTAVYTGDPAERERIQSVGASCVPMSQGDPRPNLENPGTGASSGSSSSGGNWGATGSIDWEGSGGELFLGGGGGGYSGKDAASYQPPSCYAADLYLNENKAAELTLLPVEGGPQ